MLSALTLWQPMSWAICAPHPLAKDIENRPRTLPKAMLGRETVVAVHAGKVWSDEYANKINKIMGATSIPFHQDPAIVGLMRLTGRVFSADCLPCVEHPDGAPRLNPWYSGPFGYEIADAIELPCALKIRGMLGFWPVPEDVVAAIQAQVPEGWL
jgi:hypothetical protein